MKEFFPISLAKDDTGPCSVKFSWSGKNSTRLRGWIIWRGKFLEYKAEEEQLVARVLINLHPTVMAHSAFLDRPRTRKKLINAVGKV